MIFWSPVDPIVRGYFENNPSLAQVSQQYPHLFVTSNGIAELVKQLLPNAITIPSPNDMRHKGTVAFNYMRTIDFDICVRLDVDSIVFDLSKLIEMVRETKPNQFVGWQKNFKKLKLLRKMDTPESRLLMIKRYPGKIRGACHAVGREIIERIEPLGHGPHFDEAMNVNATDAGAEYVDRRLFELNPQYTGDSPVWHPPPKGTEPIFMQHVELYNAHDT